VLNDHKVGILSTKASPDACGRPKTIDGASLRRAAEYSQNKLAVRCQSELPEIVERQND